MIVRCLAPLWWLYLKYNFDFTLIKKAVLLQFAAVFCSSSVDVNYEFTDLSRVGATNFLRNVFTKVLTI